MKLSDERRSRELFDAMNRKKNFLRNPRNSVTSITRTITRAPNEQNALFIAEPNILRFLEYASGGEYSGLVSFKNVSTTLRSLRCLPPSSKYFRMSPLEYPEHSHGLVAPGMRVLVQVHFCPDSLGDFNDCLQVQTEGGCFDVPITATRRAPQLSLPSKLSAGTCLIGNAERMEISVFNTGGFGRFILYENYQEQGEIVSFSDVDFNANANQCIRCKPFTIYPASFELNGGESICMYLEYVPISMGEHKRTFTMICDNMTRRDFEVSGLCTSISIRVSYLNSVPVECTSDAGQVCTDVYFKSLCVGSEDSLHLQLRSDTDAALEYEWIAIDAAEDDAIDVTSSDFAAVCISKLSEAERGYTISPDHLGSSAVGMGSDDLHPPSTGAMTTAPSDNTLRQRSFAVHPRKGLFPPLGELDFDVTFAPLDLTASNVRLVLMLRSVPLASMPNAHELRQQLQSFGHPSFYRLKSWLSTFAVPSSTESEALELCVSLNSMKLLTDKCEHDTLEISTELAYFREKLLKMLKCYKHWKQGLLRVDSDDEDDKETAPSIKQDEGSLMVNFGSDSAPELKAFVALDSTLFSTYLDSSETLSSLSDNGELNLLWVNLDCAVHLMGCDLAIALEALISHEAVLHLQELSQKNCPAMIIQLYGIGKARTILPSPSYISLGQIPIGKVWSGSCLIANDSAMIIEAAVDVHGITVMNKDTFECLKPSEYTLHFTSLDVFLMSESQGSFDMTLQLKCTGLYEVYIPFSCSAKFISIESLLISIESTAPKLKFHSPEVDFGLLSAGKSESIQLSFTNESEVMLRYVLNAFIDVDPETQIAILAHAMNGQSGAGDSTAKSKASSRKSQQLRSGRSDATSDSFAIKDLTATVLIDSAIGEIHPHETHQISVQLFGGSLAQRIRGKLMCTLFDCSRTFQLPTQVLLLRGEIQSPRVILSPCTVDLGDIYVGESKCFLITIENLTNLPSKYKFEKPLSDTPKFSLVMASVTGIIGPKEKLSIQCELFALSDDSFIDYIVSFKFFGSLELFGFNIKANLKTFHLDFIHDYDEKELEQLQVISAETSHLSIPRICIGKPYLLRYQRAVSKFIIRNISGCTIKFTIAMSKFISAELSGQMNIEMIRKSKLKSTFGFIEEPIDKIYHSKGGKEYILAKHARKDDQKFLWTGNGAAFVLYPSNGCLLPWSYQIIEIRAYNDAVAIYRDEIICTAESSNSIVKLYSMELNMNVHMEELTSINLK